MGLRDRLLFLDIETTGFSSEHEIFEYGSVEEDGTETVIWLPIDVSKAEEDALKVIRYYLRQEEGYKKHGMTALEGAKVIAKKTTAVTLVGNNVGPFETRLLRSFLLRNGLKPAWNHRVLDVVDLAAGVLGLKWPWKARQVSDILGIPETEATHTALGDARWNKAVYDRCVELASREHKVSSLKFGLMNVIKTDFPSEPDDRVVAMAEKWAETLIPASK